MRTIFKSSSKCFHNLIPNHGRIVLGVQESVPASRFVDGFAPWGGFRSVIAALFRNVLKLRPLDRHRLARGFGDFGAHAIGHKVFYVGRSLEKGFFIVGGPNQVHLIPTIEHGH